MNHWKFGIALVLAIAGILVPAGGCGLSVEREVVPEWGPFITGTDANSTIIGWKTVTPGSALIRFTEEKNFLTDGKYDRAIFEEAGTLHRVTLTGLLPATTYHYRIWFIDTARFPAGLRAENGIESLCAASAATGNHSFRTLGDEVFTFIVYGDTRPQPPLYTQIERHKLVAERIAAEKEAVFVINTGDLVYDNTNEEDWHDFFTAGRAMLAEKTYYPVQGNHDVNNGKYAAIFGLPPYYAFQSGGTRFVALDSNVDADYAIQAAWLEGELANESNWKFVYYHYPPFTSEANHWGGWENIRESWHETTARQHVTAVFNGHIHVYERYIEDGVTYIVIATGGAPTYHLAEKKREGYQASLEHTLGYLRVKVDREKVVMEFIMVARVSEDWKSVELYPPDTIFETIELR